MEAQHPCAMVGFENGEWHVTVDERNHSKHDTKKEAVKVAKDVTGVNTVMAFTKNNVNFDTHRC